MSFVLKLDVEAADASVAENMTATKDSVGSEGQPPPTLLFAREIWRSQEPVAVATGTTTTIGNAMVIASDDDAVAATNGGKSQLLQGLETTSNQEQQTVTATTVPTLTTVKPVVTYPVAKGAREQVQRMIAGSQTNTTEVLTTRVISQKLPLSSTDQTQLVPVTVNISSQTSTNSTSLPSPNSGGVLCPWQTTMTTVQSNQPIYQPKNQVADLIHCNKQQQVTMASNVQTTLHHKLQPTHSMSTSTTAVKAMDLQKYHTKSLPGSIISPSQSPQKIKTVTNVITNPSTIVAQRNNSLSRSQGMPKTRVLPGQFMNNQATVNNTNPQKIQLGNPMIQKTTQPVSVTNVQKTTLQSVCNNQKVPLLSGNHLPNLKTQQQGLQKLQVPQKISLAVGRQQFQSSTQQMNNVSKSSSLVTGVQKYQSTGQHFMACQQAAISSQARSQSTAIGLQKSQTLATVQTTKLQTASNVSKSNSVPNVSKSSQNLNVLTISKQQSQMQPTSAQLLQGSQQVIQKSQQQSANANNLQIQRSHSITNVHSKVISSVPNSQRTPVVMNSKVQQQQQQQQQQQTVMRVGISKSQTQAAQTVAGLKTISQKPIVNPAKTPTNSQNNAIQQPIVQRNNNPQSVKIIQQQQNVISPQNAPQKQPGCIKTIPPQKPVQRNHAQKISSAGVKPLLSPNVTGFTKTQGPTATQVTPKTCIKTLLPQQTVITPSNVIVPHKNSPIKIQQQAIQQKQLVMTPQYTQQIRQQAGQIKTLLPITSAAIEPRKDFTENKNDNEFRTFKEEEQSTPKSPVRRMPLPYECLQFVLQDHNYGAPPPRTPPPPPSPPPHPKQQPINGASSSAATSQHPFIFGPVVSNPSMEDDAASAISSEAGREVEPEGEETETAPEGEGDDEDSVTRCICDFEHDDGYMICCDRCLVWQHVDCMGIDRSNIPDEYLCERCRPRRVDRQRARALQMRKREELLNSDTSSDTSSTSSADTDVGSVNNPTAQKKRSLSQQQQPQVPRRNKSDASAQSSQVRRLNNNNNNNNNNVGKRQRRDSQARQSSAVRKKENATPKRGPGKRKAKRRTSLEDKEEDVQDAWGTNMAPLRQWIERYEEAVTNHYSPELRARISNIKVNGTHSDLRQSNMNVVATGKCRLNVHSNNLRFLVATMYLPPNTPVVELRGKYMLSTQHRLQYTQSGRQHVQRPGPFVFFYRLPRDGTEVCVDTRTYGNDARFVRRSCKPNAEVKHCIEKGTLHLYIVTTCAIEKNAEITIKHEQHDLLLSPNSNSPAMPVVCACNNPRECQISNAASQLNRRGSNGALIENADGRERRRRGRRNTVSEETDSTPPAVPPTTVTQTTTTATSSVSSTVTPATPKRTVTTTVTTVTTRQVAKEDTTATVTSTQPQTSPNLNQSVVATPETKKDKKKMTREERKMEAIMKAFERLEKAEQRKQEVQARNAQRKESGGTHSDNEDNQSTTGQSKSSKQTNLERPLRRRRRKGRARTTSSSQSQGSSRRTRLNSAESDVSSGDESNSMQSPPLLSQNRPPSRDVPYSSHLHTPSKNTTGDVSNTGSSAGGHQGIPTAAGLLLALANSNVPGPPSSPPLQQPTPVKSPTCDSGASSSSQSSTPSTPLSSACLLVAAAVGPLAPGFKFPKTKKVLMNEWLKESPDPPQTNISQVSPLPTLPPAGPPTLQNSMNPLCGRHFSPVPTDTSAEFLSQSYAAKSLATLVQAANSVSGICDSPPQRRQQAVPGNNNNNNNNNNNGNGGCPTVSTGSAKKRWLRQAISEECDSPNSRPESPPSLSETVAPPKKRRIARESLSSDNYTPPTTPTMLLPTEAASNSRSLCPADDDYTEHVQSPIMEQTDERHYDSESVKEEIKMDDRSIDSDKAALKEKLSIDIFPQSEFCIKREGKIECSDIVKMEVSSEIDIENVATKKEKISPKWEEDDKKSECNYDQLNQKIIEKIREAVESRVSFSNLDIKKGPFAKEEIVPKGTVEIIDQNEPDTEMEEFNSPVATIEPDAILKQRVVEMQLEFGGGIAEIVNITSSNEKSNDEKKPSEAVARCQDAAEKSDDNASIDEFDVEAQMKKITGDDGNDYQEKIDTSSEKDKSMDGIEGLMESSKEDSDSEDKDVDDDKYCESSFKLFDISHEETSFKESDTKPEQVIVTEDDTKETDKDTNDGSAKEISKTEESSAFAALSEESIFESTSTNMDMESIADPPKIFHSIPPLSERIRKKADPSVTPKTPKMDFEAAIIESTISMDAVEESKNGEQKSMLSTALRELLEAKLDDEPTAEVMKNDIDNEINASSQVILPKSDSSEHSLDTVQDSVSTQETPKSEETSAKEEETKPKEIKRLKDPRTVVPNSMPAPAFKPDAVPPVKRKLSISEYRKRKQQSSGGTGTEPESSNDASTTDKSGARGRSDSASSGTSSLSSDEEGSKASLSTDLTGVNASTLFPNVNENDEKKAGEEGAIGWSAAPTLVERQRENLTERLKREFGLFLSDDEEERARKQGLTAEAILKAHKSPPQNLSVVSTTPSIYPGGLPQLPPQPYIPPPGSASIHYPQFQSKPGTVQYPNFAIPPPTTSQQPVYSTAAPSQAIVVGKQTQQTPFLVPQASQAPPGSNPYPPQFVPPPPPPPSATGTAVPITKFPTATPPPAGTQVLYSPVSSGQPQKSLFNHPVPRS